jgi:hypothetical protein
VISSPSQTRVDIALCKAFLTSSSNEPHDITSDPKHCNQHGIVCQASFEDYSEHFVAISHIMYILTIYLRVETFV